MRSFKDRLKKAEEQLKPASVPVACIKEGETPPPEAEIVIIDDIPKPPLILRSGNAKL